MAPSPGGRRDRTDDGRTEDRELGARRIVANIGSPAGDGAHAFYADILGIEAVMDHDWIVTFAGDGSARPQLSIASEGGSGTPVPDLSAEVDDLKEVLAKVRQAGIPIEYGPASVP